MRVIIATLLFSLLLAARSEAADLADVTLQPWSVRTNEWTADHTLTTKDGFVLAYRTFDYWWHRISTDFGTTWQIFTGEAFQAGDYILRGSTAFTGNGYFRARSVSALPVLISTDGERIPGYEEMAVGSEGQLVAVQAFSTYVSTDSGATWTPYLNPFKEDGVNLVSFNRIFHDGTSFVAALAESAQGGYGSFAGSTWRSDDGVSWRKILPQEAVCMDSQGRLVVAKAGTIYDLVGDTLVPAHAEFPDADATIDYHRVDNRIYGWNGQLLYYSDDKGTTRYRTGFPAPVYAVWTRPNPSDGKHIVQVLLSDRRIFSSIPVRPVGLASPDKVTLHGIEMRPMLTFEGTPGVTVIIEAASSPDGEWSEVARVTATGGMQVWNDNRIPSPALFYRARSQ